MSFVEDALGRELMTPFRWSDVFLSLPIFGSFSTSSFNPFRFVCLTLMSFGHAMMRFVLYQFDAHMIGSWNQFSHLGIYLNDTHSVNFQW